MSEGGSAALSTQGCPSEPNGPQGGGVSRGGRPTRPAERVHGGALVFFLSNSPLGLPPSAPLTSRPTLRRRRPWGGGRRRSRRAGGPAGPPGRQRGGGGARPSGVVCFLFFRARNEKMREERRRGLPALALASQSVFLLRLPPRSFPCTPAPHHGPQSRARPLQAAQRRAGGRGGRGTDQGHQGLWVSEERGGGRGGEGSGGERPRFQWPRPLPREGRYAGGGRPGPAVRLGQGAEALGAWTLLHSRAIARPGPLPARRSRDGAAAPAHRPCASSLSLSHAPPTPPPPSPLFWQGLIVFDIEGDKWTLDLRPGKEHKVRVGVCGERERGWGWAARGALSLAPLTSPFLPSPLFPL